MNRKKRSSTPRIVSRSRGGRRTSRDEQRQRLVDACISALHVHGPSQTTVERVTAIARMSPGIVRFYFQSKAAMLIASLKFLAEEFEEELLIPVARLRESPVAALELLVDLYLSPQLASPRKVSVWYSFWGEASSRAEYYDLCGQKDSSFAALALELISRLIAQSGRGQLDADAISLGLMGVLEVLWQDIAFREEAQIDRRAFKRRAMNYLGSVFPEHFAAAPGRSAASKSGHAPPPAASGAGWHLAGHVAQLVKPGSSIEVLLPDGTAVVTRTRALGALQARRAPRHGKKGARAGEMSVVERDGFIFLSSKALE